jgi:hypothetical protein
MNVLERIKALCISQWQDSEHADVRTVWLTPSQRVELARVVLNGGGVIIVHYGQDRSGAAIDAIVNPVTKSHVAILGIPARARPKYESVRTLRGKL